MTYTNNGIAFNNVKEYGVKLTSGPLLINGLTGTDPDDGQGIINAIDIDWNGAEVEDNIIINTTGDLLNWIKNKSGNSSDIDSEKLAQIQDTIETYQTTFNNVLTKTYGNEHYQAKGDYATTMYVDSKVSEKIAEIVGDAPETLDTLKEIADALADNATMTQVTEAIATKANAEQVYTKDEVNDLINAATLELQADNDALVERIKKLEKAISNLNPEEPSEKNYNIIINDSNEPLTLEEIIASIDTEAEKPELVQALNMSNLSNPTESYLVYPLSWEIIENDQIVSPVIKDWNGFEIGFNINEDTPTFMVDDVEYRVSDIKLGKGSYTIEFK